MICARCGEKKEDKDLNPCPYGEENMLCGECRKALFGV